MAFLSARAPPDSMPNTIVGLSDLLSKIPSPAPQPDTILGRKIYGEGINPHTEIDAIERQPPDFTDRIRRNEDLYTLGPTGQKLWGSLRSS
jgi:hypothetical protein